MAGKVRHRLDRVVANTSVRYRPAQTIYAQGDRCGEVMFIRQGRVQLTVRSEDGRQAVVETLRAGAFFGEGALAGQRRRRSTARTMTNSTIAAVKVGEMRRGLHTDAGLSEWFRGYILARNARIEDDLIGHVFNRSEQRLAKMLLLLANFDERVQTRAPLPIVSRGLLADLLGTTRSRVNALMNTFRKLGFLERHTERDGGIQVHRSMLSVVLND